MSSPSFKRAGAAAVGAAILAAGLTAVAPAPAAHAATDPGPAADAAGWLADEFATLTSDEAGEAIDYGLAVAATDGPAEVLTSLTNGLNGVLADFLPPADPAPSQWTAINVAMAADYYATVDAIPPAETDLFNRFAGMVDDTTGQFGPSAWPYSQAYAVNALRNRTARNWRRLGTSCSRHSARTGRGASTPRVPPAPSTSTARRSPCSRSFPTPSSRLSARPSRARLRG